MGLGCELMYERQSTAAVAAGISGVPPAAIVGDGDGDLAVGDDRVQPDGTCSPVRSEGMFGGVSKSFIHREGEVLGVVVCAETMDLAGECPAQRGGVLLGRRNRYVQPRCG
jgi:hypothetical protein